MCGVTMIIFEMKAAQETQQARRRKIASPGFENQTEKSICRVTV